MKEKDNEENIKSALIKKALGYDSKETVEEYGDCDGEIKLLKKKITIKPVPPDVSALKMLLESLPDISSLTDEELEEEKQRLLKLLKTNAKRSKNEKAT